MKIFLAKLSIYVILLSSSILYINAYYVSMKDRLTPGTMDRQRNNDAIIKDVPKGIQICNFGSSHSYFGFDYQDAMKKYVCFNFALPSQSLRYDYKILEHYKDNIQLGAAVFITASYFSFFGRPEIQEDNFTAKNERYYKFLSSELIDQYDSKTAFFVKYLPVLTNSNVLKDFMLAKSNDDWSRETSAEDSDGLSRYEYHVGNRFDSNGKRIYKLEAVEALYKMIDLCREIKARPVLITTPYLHEYPDAIKENDPAFFGEFYAIIDKVKNDTGIEYYDYAFDERFSHEYKIFLNSDHLNHKGARLFTNTLLHEVLGIETD